jgi:hypothetical protein
MKKVPEMLREAAATYEQRNKIYGDNYKRFGPMMAVLFPYGVHINSPEDLNRLGIFVQVLSKVMRYAEQFGKGGHDDSLLDLAVYSTMLRELDAEKAERAEGLMRKKDWLSELDKKEPQIMNVADHVEDDVMDVHIALKQAGLL